MLEPERTRQELSDHGYELITPIGSGSFSSVFLCQCVKYNHLFAVKRVSKEEFVDHEVDALISLIHPNIVKLYLTFSNDNFQYLVMEYCKNGTIKEMNKLEKNKFIFYAKQLLEVLHYCHSQKIAHRDIKPENIFLDEYDRAKLGDFGLACKFKNQELSNSKCGSLMFAAPEILSTSEFDPFKADIWALGITFYYMATGHYPFSDQHIDTLRDSILSGQVFFTDEDVNPKIQYLIKKMTSKDPMFRPTADQLLKFPLFSKITTGKITKTVSSYPFNLKNQLKSSPVQYGKSSDTFSETDEINLEERVGSQGQKRIPRIHSIRNCNFYINAYKKNCLHYVKYD